MKKLLLIVLSLFAAPNVNAQMTDTLGVLGIDGMMNAESYQGLGKMSQSFGRVQLQQDLAMLNLEIQSRFMHGYQNLSKENLNFNGFRGIDWDVVPEDNSYYIELSGLDAADCLWCQNNSIGASRVEVSGGCRNSGNSVKLYF